MNFADDGLAILTFIGVAAWVLIDNSLLLIYVSVPLLALAALWVALFSGRKR